ncbi:MAG: 23S rRNA (adenine(2503)-C(2))-methyltransferase RlmN [Pseudomonadota bacterium]|nr:23S rRNA (adenine(2503)-C(2))-methyltransferase RlmN [Pseudomonadota bacterium]MDE3038492.1 23S rRNA (adenine(2503)-C(2))-methyltransferase RlmN [Pseudomonadota bacterium]
MQMGKIDIIGLTRQELTEALRAVGVEPFRAGQLWHWIYTKGATGFEQMTTIAKKQQALLAEHFTIGRPGIAKALVSFDGTRKWLLEFTDGNKVETVFIPEDDRGALCVSSQVGCTLSCTFCHTGTMRLVRNLTAGDIIGQMLIARDSLNEWGKKREDCLFTNIVLMGMGEPLYNYEQVARALHIVMDMEGIAISKRRITLSTSGVVPIMKRVGDELGVNLAISLHAVRDDLRDELVPINKKYPLEQLLEACRTYPAASNARRITFEYVMLKNVNDTDADARELVRLLADIHAKVNLIPFNPWPGAPYECSSNSRINSFSKIINAAGYSSPVRTPRGRDIFAACGQLKSDSERKKGEKVWLGEKPAAP